ncbi:outer membrane beta-barrel protein [Salibacteraceae bacterium]|nr:outer membrane beta-barrel protein [Salibacteraceae bacterium]
MSFTNKNINEKSFAGIVALMFLLSFFAFNSYTGYEVKHSKIDRYKYLNNYHSKRVNAKIATSFKGLSELKSFEKQSENYHLDYSVRMAKRNFAQDIPAKDYSSNVQPLISSVAPRSESADFELEKMPYARNIDFILNPVETFGLMPTRDEVEYALDQKSKFKQVNFYLGLAVNSKFGVSNYHNANYAEQFTAGIFKDYVSSSVKMMDESIAIGYGGQVFGGVNLNNGISIEGGVAILKISGNSVYNIEHSYIREVERTEWIVTGENDYEAIVATDFVESNAFDTVSSSFSRNVIQVPLNVNYSFDFGRVKPFVTAGVNVLFTSKGSQNMYSSFQDKSVVTNDLKGLNQLNLQAGVGVDIEISSRFNARIKPTLDVGVWNENPVYMNGNLRDFSIQTGLYYKF